MKEKDNLSKNETNETDAERIVKRNKEREEAQQHEEESGENDDAKTTLPNDVDSDPVKPGYGI